MRTEPAALTMQSELSSEARSEATPRSAVDLRTLFHAHYASIWRLLRRFGVPDAHLDDAAQEVFWVASRRLDDIEQGKEHAFLYGVAVRVASNVVSRQREAATKETSLEDVEIVADARPSPEEHVEQARARELLDSVLNRMPRELRTVFVLFELEGVEVRDIAAIEGIPMGTASSRLRRAREEFSAIAKRVHAAIVARERGIR